MKAPGRHCAALGFADPLDLAAVERISEKREIKDLQKNCGLRIADCGLKELQNPGDPTGAGTGREDGGGSVFAALRCDESEDRWNRGRGRKTESAALSRTRPQSPFGGAR